MSRYTYTESLSDGGLIRADSQSFDLTLPDGTHERGSASSQSEAVDKAREVHKEWAYKRYVASGGFRARR